MAALGQCQNLAGNHGLGRPRPRMAPGLKAYTPSATSPAPAAGHACRSCLAGPERQLQYPLFLREVHDLGFAKIDQRQID